MTASRVCSGSTVNSGGKNVVFTAGHCVHGGGAGRSWFDASRWVFAPSYNANKVEPDTVRPVDRVRSCGA